MTILQRRYRGDPLVKGQWYLNQDAEIKVICPSCKGIGDLNNHTIQIVINGTAVIEPSVQCECGFHDSVALKNWE